MSPINHQPAPLWLTWLAAVCIAALGACASPPSGIGSDAASQVAAPQLRIGDHWQYRIIDGFRGTEIAKLDTEVAAVNGGVTTMSVVYTDDRGRVERTEQLNGDGSVIVGTLGQQETRSFSPPLQRLGFPLIAGTTWWQTVENVHADTGKKGQIQVYGSTRARRFVDVPAGNFDAAYVYRIVRLDDETFWRSCTTLNDEIWYAPEMKAVVREVRQGSYIEKGGLDAANVRTEYSIYELISFKPAG